MIRIYRLFFLLILMLGVAPSYSEDKPTIDEFNKAYAEYQTFADQGDWSNALAHARNTYQMGKVLFGEANKNTASLSYNYGLNLMSLGKGDEAEGIFRETLKMYESIYGKASQELIPVLMDLGHSMAEPFEKPVQMKYYARALNLAKENYGEGSVNWAQLSIEAGIEMLTKARSIKAKKYLYQGYNVLEKNLGVAAPRTGVAAFYIGKFELVTKDYEKAITYFNKALLSFTLPEEPSSRIELATHGFLVEAYERLGQNDSATKHCLAIGRMTPTQAVQDYQPLVKVPPKYPASALRQGKEGYVTVEYDVDEFGFVRNPKVVNRSGSKAFNTVSLEAAKKFRYAPSFKDGEPITTAGVQNKFVFTLAP